MNRVAKSDTGSLPVWVPPPDSRVAYVSVSLLLSIRKNVSRNLQGIRHLHTALW